MIRLLEDKLATLASRIKYLQISYNVKRIGFFSSITRDDFTKKSDIDVMQEILI